MSNDHSSSAMVLDPPSEPKGHKGEAAGAVVKALLIDSQADDNKPRESKQISEDQFGSLYENEALRPPYEPLSMAPLMEQNTRLKRCIDVIARNTVGLGYDIVPLEDLDLGPESPKELLDLVELERTIAKALFDDPNDMMSFTDTMVCVSTDEESTGNGYLEVVRDNFTMSIVGLYHGPSISFRIRRGNGLKKEDPKYIAEGDGFIQVTSTNEKVYFKRFGDRRRINCETGQVIPQGKAFDPRKLATEILHFRKYFPSSRYYGVPDYVPSVPAILGNRMAAERNVVFFENDATPKMIITVSGGRLDDTSSEDVKKFLKREHKGAKNAHRILVLQATKQSALSDAQVTIDVTPLQSGAGEDASFQTYRAANDEEIREAFGIAKVILGTTTEVSRAAAAVSWESTKDQIFEPITDGKEYAFLHTIFKDQGWDRTFLEFDRPKPSDPTEDAAFWGAVGNQATINDVRRGIGIDPLDAKWADLPFPMAIAEFSAEFAPLGGSPFSLKDMLAMNERSREGSLKALMDRSRPE